MITFEISEIGQAACASGAAAGRSLLKPGHRYTFKQMLDAGVSEPDAIWFLIHKARSDKSAAAAVRAWAAHAGSPVAADASVEDALEGVKRGCGAYIRGLWRDGTPHRRAAEMGREHKIAALLAALSEE